jgi:hypothetical protein
MQPASRRTRDFETTTATVQFLAGWRSIQSGAIRPSNSLIIEYDPARMPDCRVNWRGAAVWDLEAYVRFHPGGQVVSGSVMDRVRVPPGSGVVVALVPRPFEVAVPEDAHNVELWFRVFHGIDGGCEVWDSRFGENYWFAVDRS